MEVDAPLWQSVASAGRRYNEALRQITPSELSDYERERIARVQRDIARVWHRLMPREKTGEIARAALQAPDEMTQFDGISLDNSAPSRAIRAGEAFVGDLGRLCKIAPIMNHSWLLEFFSDNNSSLQNVFGFSCQRAIPEYFRAAVEKHI